MRIERWSIAQGPPIGVEARRSNFTTTIETLKRLANWIGWLSKIAALEGSRLHARLDKLFDDEGCGLIAMSIVSDMLRQIGFSRQYATGEELLQAIVDVCSD